MTVSKSTERRVRAQITSAAESVLEENGVHADIEVGCGHSLEELVAFAVKSIAGLTVKSKKKSIYAVCDDVVSEINKGVEDYERDRIKGKAKAKRASV